MAPEPDFRERALADVRGVAREEIILFTQALRIELEALERDANAGRLYARHLRPLLAHALVRYIGEETPDVPPEA